MVANCRCVVLPMLCVVAGVVSCLMLRFAVDAFVRCVLLLIVADCSLLYMFVVVCCFCYRCLPLLFVNGV